MTITIFPGFATPEPANAAWASIMAVLTEVPELSLSLDAISVVNPPAQVPTGKISSVSLFRSFPNPLLNFSKKNTN